MIEDLEKIDKDVKPKYNIGIDMGTSSVKLILINQNGEVLAQTSIEYEVMQPKAGWKEIEPEIWYQASKKGLKQLLHNIDTSLVEGIGITGQMHTLVVLDKEGNSIRPAIMWNDTRSRELIRSLKQEICAVFKVSHISKIISTGSPAVNLLWLKIYEPEQFNKIDKFLIGPDYLVYRLTGKKSTDYCEASTSSLYDLQEDRWSAEIREILGLSETIYPEILGSGEIAGEIKEELRKEFGFSPTTRVIVGTGDNPAASISTGCLTKKYPVLSLGTSGVFMIPRDKVDFTLKGKNIKFSIDGKEIVTLVQGVVQSAGSSIDWFLKKLLDIRFFNDIENMYKKDQNPDIIFYPHLVGDKTIYANPYLRGAFLGLGTDTKREDLIIAVMEGICFAVKEIIEEMKVPSAELKKLKVIGGGSKNKQWMQMMSNVLETEIEQLEGITGAALGIALLAGYSIGNIEDLNKISERIVKVKQGFVPQKEMILYYREKYEKYKKIYEALEMVYSR